MASSPNVAGPRAPILRPGEYDAQLNGVRLHYTIRGEGPALIAHSGGPGFDARGWDDFAGIDAFVTLIVLHPRGSGLSGLPSDGGYALRDYAADVEALRQHLGLEQPMLMGWSHGGMVAQTYAFTYPGALSKLILVDTSAHFGDFLNDVEASVKGFSEEPWYAASLAALKREWAGDYATDADLAALWADEMKFYFHRFDARAAAYHARTQSLPVRIAPLKAFNENEAPAMDLRGRLAAVTAPTLIIVGRHDFITKVGMAEALAQHLPNARLVVFEHSGHFPMIEEPQRFAAVLQQFVAE